MYYEKSTYYHCIEFYWLQFKRTKKETNVLKADFEQKWSEFIQKWEAEDAVGCSEFHSENGINAPPNANVNDGKKEIAAFYGFLFNSHLKSNYSHKIVSLDTYGNQAIEYGEFEVNWTTNDSLDWTLNARSLTHWKQGEKGDWKIEKIIFNKAPSK